MFKKILTSVLAASMLLMACSCGTGKKDSGDKVYVVATDTTFAPFEFQDGNDFVGIDMDLLKAIAEDQGFEYKIDVLGFNAAVQALEVGQCDAVIAGMSITEDRQKKFDFTEPYFDSGVVMAIAESNDEIKSYEDYESYVKYVEGALPTYDADEIANMIHYFNPDITYADFEKEAVTYSLPDIMARHAYYYEK